MDYILQLIKLIIILGIFVYGAYFIAKKMKKQQINKLSPNRMIQVIDGVQLGMKEEIVLMKVGKEYILLSTSSGHMIPLKQEEITVDEEKFEEMFAKENPEFVLKNMTKSLRDKWVKK